MILRLIWVISKQTLIYVRIHWNPANEIWHECLFQKSSVGVEVMSWMLLLLMIPQAGIRLRGHRIFIKIEVKSGRTFIKSFYTSAHSLVENDFDLSKSLNQTRLSVNHSANYDLQTKHCPNNGSEWVLCHHICDSRIEKTTSRNRYSNSQPIVNQFWIPEGRKTREKAISQIFFQCGFQDAS